MKREFNLKKVTTPVLLHLLQDEILFPRVFILRCLLTLGKFKKSIDPRFPRELVDLTALPLWVYMNLKEKIGQKRAFEVMRIPILAAGIVKQNILFDNVNKERNFENFIAQELEINRTGTTKWNTIEDIKQSEKKLEFKVTRCLYHEQTTSLGVPEATPLVCQVDNALFNSYMPEKMIFHRDGLNRRIADGSRECHFVWELVE
jgi:hypothetical protein